MNSDSQNERMTMVIMAKKNLRHTILHFNVHIMRELFPFSDCSNSCKMLQDNHVFIRGGFLVSMLRYLCRESHITVSSIYKRFFLPQRFFYHVSSIFFFKKPRECWTGYTDVAL